MQITVSLHSLLLISCLCYTSWSQVCDTHIRGIIPTNISKLAAMSIFRFQPQKIEDQSSSKQKDRNVFCCRLQSDITASRVTICLYSNVNCVTTRGDRGNQLQNLFLYKIFCALDESWWRDRERGRRKKKKKKRTANIWSWEAAAFLHSLLDTNTHTLYAGSYKHTHTQIHMRTHTRIRQHTFTYQHKCT